MESKVVTVNPELAKRWLDNMGENRRLRPRHVDYLTNEITQGHWQLTHQGIAFNELGQLIDGQHRLAAIINSGKSVQVLVTNGVHQSKFVVFDRNAPRNMSDLTNLDRKFTVIYNFLMYYTNPHLKTNPADVVQIHKCIGSYLSQFYAFNPGGFKSKLYGSAPFKSAAIVQSILSGDSGYVFNLYKIIDRQLYDLMPPVAKAFCKGINSGDTRVKSLVKHGRDYSYLLFEKALYIFDKNKANSQNVRVGDGLSESYRVKTVELVNNILTNKLIIEPLNISDILNKEKFYKHQLETKIAIQAAKIDSEINKLSMESCN